MSKHKKPKKVATFHPVAAPAPGDKLSGPSVRPPGAAPAANPYNPQQMPFDPAYESAVGSANTQFDVTNAGLQYQEGRVKQTYGFDDPSDPFNRAAMLERSYHQSQSGILNSGAASGQLYAGSTQRGLDEGSYQYNRSRSGLQQEYQDQLQQIAQQRAQAGADQQSAISSAGGERLDRALAATPQDPGVPPSAPKPPKPPKKKKKHH